MSNQPEVQTVDRKRRQFLGGTAAVAGVTLAPGVMLSVAAQARPADQAVSNTVRWGLLVDTTQCADCNECVKACQNENAWGDASRNESRSRDTQKAQWIRKVELRNTLTGSTHSLPMFCQHCENPPCTDVCPTGASFKRADGIVLVDKHICIGCRYCMMACPYKARSFIHEALKDQASNAPRGKGTVESCTLCVGRVDAGRNPACVEACNKDGHQAMLFGDLNDPNSEIARRVAKYATTQIRADLGLNPGVRYQGI